MRMKKKRLKRGCWNNCIRIFKGKNGNRRVKKKIEIKLTRSIEIIKKDGFVCLMEYQLLWII